MTLHAWMDAPSIEVPSVDRVGRGARRALRRGLEIAHWTVPAAGAAAAGWVTGAAPLQAGAVAVAWLTTYALVRRPRWRSLTADAAVRLLALPVALAGFLAAVGLAGTADLRAAVIAGVAGTALAQVVTVLTARVAGPLRVLLLGDDAGLVRVLNRWASSREVEVVGVRALHGPSSEAWLPREVAAQAGELGAAAVVVLPGAGLGPIALQQLGWALEGTGTAVQVQTDLEEVGAHRITVSSIEGIATAEIAPSRPAARIRAAKGLLDRAGAAALLLLTAPLLLAMLVVIRRDSSGPALFRQTRVGRHGRHFTLYKLRTMETDAEAVKLTLHDHDEGNGVLFKMHSDPRVTRVGRWLRRTSLDELPQLINVLRGEMSLVGPRPALPEEVATYDDRVRRRLAVRPGMTGLWQVSGRSDLDWERSVTLDLSYADNVTVLGDLHLCLRTVRAVTSGRGAY